MKAVEIQVKINLAQREADYWRNVLAKKSCHDCENFHHPETGGCSLAEGQMPPPEVVKTACPEWSWDCIPF